MAMQIHGLGIPVYQRPQRASSVSVDGLAGSVEPGLLNQAQIGALLQVGSTHELWRAQIPTGAQAAPSLGPQGQIAVTTESGVSVFNADGTPAATIEQTWLERSCAPAFDPEGNIYVTGWSQPGVRSYTPSGALRYKLDELYGSDASPVVDGDRLYYAEGTGWLNSLNAKDGSWRAMALKFSDTLVGSKARSLARAPDGSLLLVNDKGHVLRIRDGKEEWRSRDSVRLSTKPLAVGDDLVFCDNFGNLRCVDKQGELVWGFSWRNQQRFTGESEERLQTAGFGSTPALSPDQKTLYVVQRQLFGHGPTPLSAFDLDGNHLWTKELPLPVDSPAHHLQVDKDGFLYVAGNYGGSILCLNPEGETQWRFANGSQGQIHFAVHGDTLHVATESGWMHAIQRDALRKQLEGLKDAKDATPTVVIQDDAVTVGGVRLKTRKP
ncbi:hypothetical protein DYH09_33625 [bacterium CPR1]|nr:hypothetical protein [bacterium CPR1]